MDDGPFERTETNNASKARVIGRPRYTLKFLLMTLSGVCIALGLQLRFGHSSGFMYLATGFALCASVGGPIGYVLRGRDGVSEGIVIAVIVGILYGLIAIPAVQMGG
jgi:hypothetical protein